MKKIYLLTICCIFILPSFASCKLDDLGSCSIQHLREPLQKVYSQTSIIKQSVVPSAKLNPIENKTPERELRKFGPQPSDYNYNTSCQFGICRETNTQKLFQNRGK